MPVLRGNLIKEDKAQIRKNYTFLLVEIDGDFLADHLYEKEVFDEDDKEEISSQSSGRKKASLFLKKLLHSGPRRAYGVFLDLLRQHYPHVAERLEDEDDEEEIQVSTEAKKYQSLVKHLVNLKINNQNPNALTPKYPKSTHLFPVLSFDKHHLHRGFRYNALVDYIRSLAEQTGLIAVRDVGKTKAISHPLYEKRKFKDWWSVSGRVWRVQRQFSEVDNKTCPCLECKESSTPKKQWGEFIVITSRQIIRNTKSCRQSLIALGYDSPKDFPAGVSALRGVSVISSGSSLDDCKALYITHDAHTSKRVEDICRRNDVCRDKLLNKCHLFKEGEKMFVLVAHPSMGPKHVYIGKHYDEDEDVDEDEDEDEDSDKDSDDSGEDSDEDSDDDAYSRKRIKKKVEYPNCRGGPLLVVNDRLPYVTVFDKWNPHTGMGMCSGHGWSM